LLALVTLTGGSASGQTVGAPAPRAPEASTANASSDSTDAHRLHVQFGVGYEGLSNGYSPWRSAVLGARTVGRTTSVHGTVEESTRFSQLDHNATIGFERHLNSRWRVSGEAELSPSHHFSPLWGVLGQAGIVGRGGWNLTAGVRHRRYSSSAVDMVSTTLERYVSRYRAAYSLYVTRLHGGATAASHRVQGDVYYGPSSSSVGVSVAAGAEVESLGPSGLLRTDVRAAAVTGRHWFSPNWFLQYDALVHQQGAFYWRRRLGAALGRRF
jgi:YaiO family outer membrane protein